MFTIIDQFIRKRQKVKIYFGNETDYVVSTITEYYIEYGLIRIAINNLILPLEIIAKIEPLEIKNSYSSRYNHSPLYMKRHPDRDRNKAGRNLTIVK